MKNYIIVGDNNVWYSTTGIITELQLKEEIETIKQYISDNFEEAKELYAYEVTDNIITVTI